LNHIYNLKITTNKKVKLKEHIFHIQGELPKKNSKVTFIHLFHKAKKIKIKIIKKEITTLS
jgi:hypothetical protein